MKAWGFTYKSNLIWHKVRKDGGSDGRGVGFYFRNVTELVLFGVRGKNARTLPPARSQSIFLRRVSANIRASPMSSMRLYKRAARVPTLKCLLEGSVKIGLPGEIKQTKDTIQLGIHIVEVPSSPKIEPKRN